jgi:hypothetical protein
MLPAIVPAVDVVRETAVAGAGSVGSPCEGIDLKAVDVSVATVTSPS